MRLPVRPLRGAWPAPLERRLGRLFWSDPSVVVDGTADAAGFRTAMAAFNVGSTIKITGSNRHPGADALLLDHVDTTGLRIVDIGASDGSTSVDLIARLPGFAEYVVADLYLHVDARRAGRSLAVHDPDGAVILLVGRHVVAWPSVSRPVALLTRPWAARIRRRAPAAEPVLLLNPDLRRLAATDPRVRWATHDVFTPWPGPAPDVVKVANLLRRLYFPDADIERALRVLLADLAPGGHLLVVDNPRIEGIDTRAGLYRRAGDRFEPVAATEHPAEIDDLVVSVRL